MSPDSRSERVTSSPFGRPSPSLQHKHSVCTLSDADTSSIASSSQTHSTRRPPPPPLQLTPLSRASSSRPALTPQTRPVSRLSRHNTPRRERASPGPSPTSPLSPSNFVHHARVLRSQVSMDALDSPRRLSSPSSLYSSHSMSSLASPTRRENDESANGGPTAPTNTRLSWMYLRERSITVLPLSPANRNFSHPNEQEEVEPGSPPATTPAEAETAVRSAPGVIGIGEGWAGGPQAPMSNNRHWFQHRREQSTDDDDPLYLWANDSKTGQSPVRALWNRSRTAFGASMPVLPSSSPEAGSSKPRSSRGFKRHSRNLSDGPHAVPDDKAPQRRSFSNFFSRSQVSVHKISNSIPIDQPSTVPMPSSRVFPSPPSPKSTQVLPQSHFARSESDLASASALPALKYVVGPRPPWRPLSFIGTPNMSLTFSTPVIPEVDENPRKSGESGVDGEKKSQKSQKARSSKSSKRKSAVLPRSGTSQINDITMEHGLGITADNGEYTYDIAEPFSSVQRIVIEEPVVERQPIVERQPVGDSEVPRRRTLFKRIKLALTPTSSKNNTPTSTPDPSISTTTTPTTNTTRSNTPSLRIFGKLKKDKQPSSNRSRASSTTSTAITDNNPAYTITQQAITQALDTQAQTMSVKHRRRASWMSGDSWAKRLSKLTEQDEDESMGAESVGGGMSPGVEERRRSFFENVLPLQTASPGNSKPRKRTTSLVPTPRARSTSLVPSLQFPRNGGIPGNASMPSLPHFAPHSPSPLPSPMANKGPTSSHLVTGQFLRVEQPNTPNTPTTPNTPNTPGRHSIIDIPTLERDFPFPSPPSRASSPSLRRASYLHNRGSSEPTGSVSKDTSLSGHSRHTSEPIDGSTPALDEMASNQTMSESGGSSIFPETPYLHTPFPPSNAAYQLHSHAHAHAHTGGMMPAIPKVVVPRVPGLNVAQNPSTASVASNRSDGSYYSARDALEVPDQNLQLAKENSRDSDLSGDGVACE